MFYYRMNVNTVQGLSSFVRIIKVCCKIRPPLHVSLNSFVRNKDYYLSLATKLLRKMCKANLFFGSFCSIPIRYFWEKFFQCLPMAS